MSKEVLIAEHQRMKDVDSDILEFRLDILTTELPFVLTLKLSLL